MSEETPNTVEQTRLQPPPQNSQRSKTSRARAHQRGALVGRAAAVLAAKLDADHQAAAAHVGDGVFARQQREAPHQLRAARGRVGNHALGLDCLFLEGGI
jgi:hypothetical protein